MKSGRSIQDVSREILRQQDAKADYLVATDRLHMDTWGDNPVIRVLDHDGIDQIEPLEIQPTAHQQIGTYHVKFSPFQAAVAASILMTVAA